MMTRVLFLLTIITFLYSQHTELKDANSIFLNTYAFTSLTVMFVLMVLAGNDTSKKVTMFLERFLEYAFVGQVILFVIWYLFIYSYLILPSMTLGLLALVVLAFDEWVKARKNK